MRVVFVANHEQLASLRYSGAFDDTLVASLSFSVTQELRIEGAKVFDLLGSVTEEMILADNANALAVCADMAHALKGSVTYQNVDIVERMTHELLYPLWTFLHARRVVSAALDALAPSEVVHFSEMCQSFAWDPPNPPPDIFNAVVSLLADERKLSSRLLHCKNEAGGTVAYKGAKTGPSLGLATLAGTIKGVCFAAGISVKEQELLFSRLARDGNGDWVAIVHGGSLTSLPAMPSVPEGILHRLPFELTGVAAHVERIRLEGFPSIETGEIASYLMLLQHPRLRFVWDDYCARLVRGARACAMGRMVGTCLRPRVVICGYDAFGEVRCIEQACLDAGIPVISVDHGGVGARLAAFRSAGARAHVAVWGAHDALFQTGRAGSVVAVGSLRQDIACATTPVQQPQHAVEAGTSCDKRKTTVLLLTSKIDALWSTGVSTRRFEQVWGELRELFRRRRDWCFLLRPHPRYDYHRLYESVIRSIPNVRIAKGSLVDVLATTDVAVMVDIFTTAGLEAIGQHVPLVMLKDACFGGAVFSCPIEDAVPVSRSVAALEDEITHLTSDCVYRETVLARETRFLNEALVASGEAAVDNMCRFIEEVALPERKPGAEDASLRSLFDILVGAQSLADDCNVYRWLGSIVRCKRLPEDLCEKSGLLPWPELQRYVWQHLVSLREDAETLRPSHVVGCYLGLPARLRPRCGVFRRSLSAGLIQESYRSGRGLTRRTLLRAAGMAIEPARLARAVRNMRGRLLSRLALCYRRLRVEPRH